MGCDCCKNNYVKNVMIVDGQWSYFSQQMCKKEMDQLDKELARNVTLYYQDKGVHLARAIIKDTEYVYAKDRDDLMKFLNNIYNIYFEVYFEGRAKPEESSSSSKTVTHTSTPQCNCDDCILSVGSMSVESMIQTIKEDGNEIVLE